jgi:Spy/CpxP family protein refolding chaperone
MERRHQGHGRGFGGGDFGRDGFRGGFGGITLTDDQKARMKQIHESFNERTKALREQLRAKHQELRQASEGGTFNEALATQKLQEAAGLQAKLMGERFKLRQETESVLTAEQKAQLEQKRAEMKARRAERGTRKVQ